MSNSRRIAFFMVLALAIGAAALFVLSGPRDAGAGSVNCYPDADLDGVGELGSSPSVFGSCPDGWSELNTDCDDTDFSINPLAPELPDDGIDQDCGGDDLVTDESTGYFVSQFSGNDANAGTKAAPFATIGKAIDVINTTDGGPNVFVGEGTYDEAVETNVSIFGGYNPIDGWSRDIEDNETTINGQATNLAAVFVLTGSTVAIQGFTINGPTGLASTRAIATDTDTRVTIVDNVLDGGNGSSAHHGILFLTDYAFIARNEVNGGNGAGDSTGVDVANQSKVWIEDNDIDGGIGVTVTGLDFHARTGVVLNNTIEGGTATGTLANTIVVATSDDELDPVFINNIIEFGSSTDTMNGVSFASGNGTFVNNVIFDTQVVAGGATTSRGVAVFQADATLVNNFIHSGTGSNAQGVFANTGAGITLINNDIWGASMDCMVQPVIGVCVDSLVALHLCLWTGCDDASGNITENPIFVGVNDFHVNPSSPLIDAGIDPATWYGGDLADLDFEGDPRPQDAGWDIGVDERSTTTTTTTTTTTITGATTTTTIPGDDDADDDDADDDDANDDDADD
ncbi:hypothetical protein K8I61_16445, partial [bacterium]|nr:hypothetical protein [bacterium]